MMGGGMPKWKYRQNALYGQLYCWLGCPTRIFPCKEVHYTGLSYFPPDYPCLGVRLPVTAKYLLPCSCGRHVVVEPRQAGQTLSCPCGASLTAPTLLGLAALDPAPDEPVVSASAWGFKQRLQLIGGVLLLAAAVGGAWLYGHRPISPTIDARYIQATAKKFTPSQAWTIWKDMEQQGLDRRIDQRFADAVIRFRIWMVVVGCIALAGATLCATAKWGARDR